MDYFIHLTSTQRKGLAEFFSMTAVAWLTGGMITPLFGSGASVQRLLVFPAMGLLSMVILLSEALKLWKSVDYV